MSETSFTTLDSEPTNRWSLQFKCFLGAIGTFSCIHFLLMVILVANVATIAPEMKTTLQDVKILVPQMHKTISELGVLLPEITQGMRILKQLCQTNDQCSP